MMTDSVRIPLARWRFITAFLLCSGFTVLVGVIFCPILMFPKTTGLARKVMVVSEKFILLIIKKVAGVSWRIEGEGNLPESPFIIASKHQSNWETFFLTSFFQAFNAVVKKELLYIPVVGFFIKKVGGIFIDRRSGPASRKKLKVKASQRQGNFLIFPEGTRTLPGQQTHYKSGVFLLYQHLNLPVLPVAINSGLFLPEIGPKYRGVITVSLLEAIPPGLDKAAFMSELVKKIETESARLLPPGLAEKINLG